MIAFNQYMSPTFKPVSLPPVMGPISAGPISNIRYASNPEVPGGFTPASVTPTDSSMTDLSHGSVMTGSDHLTSGVMSSPSVDSGSGAATGSSNGSMWVIFGVAAILIWLVLK